jgi:hypothetical protein
VVISALVHPAASREDWCWPAHTKQLPVEARFAPAQLLASAAVHVPPPPAMEDSVCISTSVRLPQDPGVACRVCQASIHAAFVGPATPGAQHSAVRSGRSKRHQAAAPSAAQGVRAGAGARTEIEVLVHVLELPHRGRERESLLHDPLEAHLSRRDIVRRRDLEHLRLRHDVDAARARARGAVEATTERRVALVDDAVRAAVPDGGVVTVHDGELALVQRGGDGRGLLERCEVRGEEVRDADRLALARPVMYQTAVHGLGARARVCTHVSANVVRSTHDVDTGAAHGGGALLMMRRARH